MGSVVACGDAAPYPASWRCGGVVCASRRAQGPQPYRAELRAGDGIYFEDFQELCVGLAGTEMCL